MAAAYGQTITFQNSNPTVNIGEQVYILEDPEGTLVFSDILDDANRSRFRKSEQVILNFGITESYHWIYFRFNNPTNEDLLLELAQAQLPVADFYALDGSGEVISYSAGYNIHIDNREIEHHYQVFPLPPGESEIFIRVRSYLQPIPISIQRKKHFSKATRNQLLTYGTYVGILLFVVLNNLFLYFSLRKFPFLHYGVLAFAHILISAIVMDGYILFVLPDIDMLYWYNMLPLSNMPITLAYAIVFLELKKYAPRSYRVAVIALIYFVSYMVWNHFLPILAVITVNQVHALINLSMVAYLGLRAGYKGNRVGYYYSSAYFIYFAIVIVEILYIQTGNPPYLFKLSHVSYALFIEVLILAYALTKRFEWEREELEQAEMEAQLKLLAQTQEKERIVKEQNIRLEEEVAKRTNELQITNIELKASLQAVEEERRKSDELLKNILPEATAEELKRDGEAKPRTYESVTVVFVDFKDFTQKSESISPEKLVDTLNQTFTEFDKIVKKHNLEKIKTVGDAYMAVGGLPIANNTHAIDAVNAALEMQEFIMKWQDQRKASGMISWDARIGIHTGHVVAGVVGMDKFTYDIWGVTVNTAARMEEHGSAGRVNVSSITYELIKDHFKCTSRGKVNVKGRGDVEMYWVEASPELQA